MLLQYFANHLVDVTFKEISHKKEYQCLSYEIDPQKIAIAKKSCSNKIHLNQDPDLRQTLVNVISMSCSQIRKIKIREVRQY